MELREALVFSLSILSVSSEVGEGLAHKVRVPHSDGILDTNLPHEQAVHPSKGELNEFDTLLFHVLGKGTINAARQIS